MLPVIGRLDEIPGVGPDVAQVIVAELGMDMTQFPTPGHAAAWARLTSRTIQSGATTRNGRTGKGDPYLRGALGHAAMTAGRTGTFPGERYRRIARRRAKKKAIVAVARTITEIACLIISDPGIRFIELGPDYCARFDAGRQTRNKIRDLERLNPGMKVTLTPRGLACPATVRDTPATGHHQECPRHQPYSRSSPITPGGLPTRAADRCTWEPLSFRSAAQNPDALPKALAALRHRSAEAARLSAGSRELQELDALSLASLREVAYLGGYVPGAGIFPGERYDARFLEDRLVVVPCRQADVLTEVPYSEVEDVDIGGPGLVRTGGGFGAAGAVEGMAIAAVLNGLTTRTSIKTVVRIQGTACELFLLHTTATPEQLRIELSRSLGAIRSAPASLPAGRSQHQAAATSASPVEELTRLAAMLETGLLTREEFNQTKAKLLGATSWPR